MKLELNDPSMPPGTPFYVTDLGAFENGKATEFSAEQVDTFEAAQGRTIQKAFADHATIKIVDSKVAKEVND